MANYLFNELTIKKNQLHCEDCLTVLLKLKEARVKVDLIYLDPPFNSNRIYNIIFRDKGGGKVQQAVFADTFANRNIQQLAFDLEYFLQDERMDEAIRIFLKAWIEPLRQQNKPSDRRLLSYLIYMAQRLIAMRDVLSDTGTIYYHCDPTVSHYIKIIMDGIFKRENFRNEIVWCYQPGSHSKNDFGKKHDVLFRYSKTDNYHLDDTDIKEPYAEATLTRLKYKGAREKNVDKVMNRGGRRPVDYWYYTSLQGNAKESKGYNTQKPLSLLNRIIQSSCPPDGIVLDPFCGCGTTIDSAVDNKRKWIGIDVSEYAVDVITNTLLERRGISKDYYELSYANPESIEKYKKMTPLEKQDFAIRAVGGTPNDRHSGDEGIDGDMVIHLGIGEDKDMWGKMVFSVKTGKQCKPENVRELLGTMAGNRYNMAGLIVDCDPTSKMLEAAEKAGQIKYHHYGNETFPPDIYDQLQILSIDQIINQKLVFDTPYTLKEIKQHRDKQTGARQVALDADII